MNQADPWIAFIYSFRRFNAVSPRQIVYSNEEGGLLVPRVALLTPDSGCLPQSSSSDAHGLCPRRRGNLQKSMGSRKCSPRCDLGGRFDGPTRKGGARCLDGQAGQIFLQKNMPNPTSTKNKKPKSTYTTIVEIFVSFHPQKEQ